MTAGRSRTLLLLALISAAGAHCGDREARASGTKVVRVKAINVQRDVRTSGKIVPEVGSEVKIGPRISGRLEKLYVGVGDLVRKGTLIAEIDTGTLTQAVRNARAALEQADADERYSEASYRRAGALHRAGLVSEDAVELAERDWTRSRASSKAAKSALDAAVIELGYTKLYSPIDGVVGSVSTQEGETVAASFAAPTFVTIVNLNRLKALAYLDEYDVSLVKPGVPLRFTVEALPGREFGGRVRSINPQAITRDNITTYVANVDITEGDATSLRPDMTAAMTIRTGQSLRIVVVPPEAVLQQGDETDVLVKNGTSVERRRVQLGERFPEGVHVREGLAEGQNVVIQPQDAAR